jgi:hypothetical protein
VPTAQAVDTRQSVKNTSLTTLPSIVSISRISMPGIAVGTCNRVKPSCLPAHANRGRDLLLLVGEPHQALG